jgi:hypothetical protein
VDVVVAVASSALILFACVPRKRKEREREMATMEEVRDALPGAMEELAKNQETIKQIADFCRDAYVGDKEAEVFGQTRDYTTNALLNVAYHVQNIATQLTAFVSAQLSEIDKLDSHIRVVTEVSAERERELCAFFFFEFFPPIPY